MGHTLYTRESGPICYELPLFPDEPSASSLLRQLIGCHVRWYWMSERCRPFAEENVQQLPEVRAVTLLTESNAGELLQDILESDVDGYGRFIALFGVDPAVKTGAPVRDWLDRVLKTFLRSEEGPLWLVVIQIGDCPAEHLYVTHVPPAPVGELLQSWEVNDTNKRKVRKYHTLYTAALEELRLLQDPLAEPGRH